MTNTVSSPAAKPALEGLDGLAREPFSRRGFVMTGLITGFTLATTVVHGQAIKTDSAGLEAGDVMIPTSDGQMPAYRAMPAGAGPFPIVLVIEEIFGVHEYLKDTCRRLAKLGYCAIAPEIYARQGDLTKMTDIQQIVSQVISKKPDAELLSDLDATAKWAATSSKGDAAKLGVTGFCRGGRAVWLYAAHNPSVKASVAWYGPLGGSRTDIQPKTAADVAADIKAPVLGLYGGADTGIPVTDVEKQRDTAKAAGKTVEIVIYPDTPHAFHADYRPSYRKQPAEDGWARMLAWFKTYGVA
ncbi:dienelactone hydrolase family protein [Bosea caraganae]|uniref:Dienelactone hydrolase family protein n=1 Tax=Bosea caraganae TaxID=2763117 RepID=A0A370LCV6_9HYPH|nr:dienelactone hydrolase family protein [Bosea caraganae]RDJ27646.1 dienelactone hydrolase family protein [Bosea caraganae]RDJ29660.1 dienelactone hydrolase family protein [Bosea caraganae]